LHKAPTSEQRRRNVALVHDFLLDLRGAERVFLELCRLWPEADLFTAVYDEEGTEGRFAERRVHTSFLQRLRPTSRTFRPLLPLYPRAIESLDLAGYDLVISSSSAWAHGVRCAPQSVHLSYCHNPFRYAWSERDETLSHRPWPLRPVLGRVFERWRRWDQRAAARVHRYVANSELTQRRIRAYFGRSAEIVHPPVRTDRFAPARERGEHYLCVSELMAHKQLDVAIEAFNHLARPLVIVGDGPDLRRLRRLAGPTITFAGRLADADVACLLATSRALVMTGVEEFGITAVESQASGRPVIARAEGGALETIIDGVTGRLWTGGTTELIEAVTGFDDAAVAVADCLASAERFSVDSFARGIEEQVVRAFGDRPELPAPDPSLAAGAHLVAPAAGQ
jgi:glycosyltransferase involved in cell wall biosynthesis